MLQDLPATARAGRSHFWFGGDHSDSSCQPDPSRMDPQHYGSKTSKMAPPIFLPPEKLNVGQKSQEYTAVSLRWSSKNAIMSPKSLKSKLQCRDVQFAQPPDLNFTPLLMRRSSKFVPPASYGFWTLQHCPAQNVDANQTTKQNKTNAANASRGSKFLRCFQNCRHPNDDINVFVRKQKHSLKFDVWPCVDHILFLSKLYFGVIMFPPLEAKSPPFWPIPTSTMRVNKRYLPRLESAHHPDVAAWPCSTTRG